MTRRNRPAFLEHLNPRECIRGNSLTWRGFYDEEEQRVCRAFLPDVRKEASCGGACDGHPARPVVADLIRESHPEWSDEGFICIDDLDRYRYKYVGSLVEAEKGELSDVEREVLES